MVDIRATLGATIFAASVLATFWPSSAQASGDYGCGPQWKVVQGSQGGSGSCGSVAMLSPTNDTRTNMLMLLADRRGVAGAHAPRETGEAEALYPNYYDDSRWPVVGWRLFSSRFAAMDRTSSDEDRNSGPDRCHSNKQGAAAFITAVGATKGVTAAESTALVAARTALRDDCMFANGSVDPLTPLEASLTSTPAKQLFAYLRGASDFYTGNFARADAQFAIAAQSSSPWVKEAATFMLGRVAINQLSAQVTDKYGSREWDTAPDAKSVAGAEARLASYLKAYPSGAYRGSATGLMRRIYWLDGESRKLADSYAPLLASRTALGSPPSDIDLIHEIDLKMLPSLGIDAKSDVVALASINLAAMREFGYTPNGQTELKLTRARLEAQKPFFADAPELYTYLDASFAFHVEKNPAAVLKLIPDAARQSSYTYLQFSGQMLRGLALEAVKDKNSGGFWSELAGGVTNPVQRDLLDLAAAMHAERNGGLDRVFATNSTIKNVGVRQILLKYSASPAILRTTAQNASATPEERDVALFTLLYKQVSRGRYGDFLKDLALVPDGAMQTLPEYSTPGYTSYNSGIFLGSGSHKDFVCPTLKETATRLAANPKAVNARLCLAEFMRVKAFDQNSIDTKQDTDILGGGPSMFPGKAFSRLDLYRDVIADPKAVPNDKAYALYRAVRCYAPSKFNSCGGVEASVVQRKAWFMQLKRDYPGSIWAQDLSYYW